MSYRLQRWGLLCLVLIVTVTIAADQGGRKFGAYVCSGGCTLAIAMPDPSTVAFIDALNRGPSFPASVLNQGLGMIPGDEIMVCNATHCATYLVTEEGRYQGRNLEERTSSREPGGQAGGREGGGGRAGGGGCVGSCGTGGGSAGGGTVNVGDPRPVKQET